MLRKGCAMITQGSLMIMQPCMMHTEGCGMIRQGCMMITQPWVMLLQGRRILMQGCVMLTQGCIKHRLACIVLMQPLTQTSGGGVGAAAFIICNPMPFLQQDTLPGNPFLP